MSTRELRYVDGASAKFWRITLDGTTHTVQFGRLGTAGQTQTKTFEDTAKARDAYQKLIGEKLRKGYVEVEGDATDTNDAPGAQVSTPPLVAPEPVQHEPAAQTPTPAPATHTVEVDQTLTAGLQWPPQRALNLDPADWLWATWRPRPVLVRPVAAPFDQAAAAARVAKVPAVRYGWEWRWEKADIAPSLTREEAHFWYSAMIMADREVNPAALANTLRGMTFDGKLDLSTVRQTLIDRSRMLTPEIMLPLAMLFSLPDLLAVMIPDHYVIVPNYYRTSATPVLVAGFRRYLLPYLTPDEVALIHEHLRRVWPSLTWPTNYSKVPSPAFFLAAATGLHGEVRALVAGWPDDLYSSYYHDYYHCPQQIVFGLGDPREVETHMQRLKLDLKEPLYIRAWLAHTEFSALDLVRDSVLASANKETAADLISAFAVLEAPEVAPHMLQLMLDSKVPQPARVWLETHPAQTISGLIPVEAGRGRLAEAALDLLRRLGRRGHQELIRRALDEAQVEDAARLRDALFPSGDSQLPSFDDETTPSWLRDAIRQTAAKRRAAATWVQAADLPPIAVGQHRLNETQVAAVLHALQASRLDRPDPLIAALKAQADPASLERFAWQLFQLWLADGAPSKENWALVAVGLLGGDTSVLKLTPLIRAWPGESQHARAVLGLEVLRAIGTDTALMQINGIAQKVQFKGLQAKAREAMAEIARDRGLTPEQLEDRIVPDCDLDTHGSRLFHFGPRQFRFVLGPDLKPLIRDEAGKLKPDLPKPGAKDDPARAEQAVSSWKLLKKQVAEVAKIQSVRLEQAMVTGRRWSAAEFRTLLVDHPLLIHLVQRVVWGVYDAGGSVVATFRVTEDRTFADSADESYDLDPGATVGIVHPLQLTAAERSAWGELLSDYEIVQPFPQLGRPTYALTPEELAGTEITRFKDITIPATALVFTLDKLGWVRGAPMDAGVFDEHSRPFVGANVTAVVQYDGVPVGYYDGWDDQKMERCFFVRGIVGPQGYRKPEGLPLAEIDPVAISEVLNDLSTVAAKGK